MTKIGEGDLSPTPPTAAAYQKELDTSSEKFLTALDQYNQSKSSDEQKHLKGIMDQQMGLIQAALKELNQKGIHKEGSKVVKDYVEYKEEESQENYMCLRNDLETLREHNQVS